MFYLYMYVIGDICMRNKTGWLCGQYVGHNSPEVQIAAITTHKTENIDYNKHFLHPAKHFLFRDTLSKLYLRCISKVIFSHS